MRKKTAVLMVLLFFMVNISGCVALLAGAAGGAGTATWLSGKLTKEVKASQETSLKAVRSALKSLKLTITKETRRPNIIQVMGKYTDGKTVWIDIRSINSLASQVSVRVGIVSDEEAARRILNKIERYL